MVMIDVWNEGYSGVVGGGGAWWVAEELFRCGNSSWMFMHHDNPFKNVLQ